MNTPIGDTMNTTLPLYRVQYTWYDEQDNYTTESKEIRAESPLDAIFNQIGADPENVNFTVKLDEKGNARFTEIPDKPTGGGDTDWVYEDAECIRERTGGADYDWAYWNVFGPLTKKICSCCNGKGEVDA